MNDITKTLNRLTMYDGLIEFSTENLSVDPYSRQSTLSVIPSGELNDTITSPTGIDDKTQQLYRWFRGKFSDVTSQPDDDSMARLIQQSRATFQNMVTEVDERRRTSEIVAAMDKADTPDSTVSEVLPDDTPDTFDQTGINTQQVIIATTNQLNESMIRTHRTLSFLQTDMRRLLDYQLRVQFKLDTTKIELLNRTYLLNLKYYKFAEKATLIQTAELRKSNTRKGVRGLGSGLLDVLKGKGGFFELLKTQMSNVVVAVERDLSKRLVDFAGRGNALLTKRYDSYEEYLDDIIPKGQKPLPEVIFNRLNPRVNQAASYLKQYTDITLRGPKDQKLRIKKAIWSNRSDNTLNVIIPKLLDDIRYYASGGRARRGYDDPFAGAVKPVTPPPGGGGGSDTLTPPSPSSDVASEKMVERVLRRVSEANDKVQHIVKEGVIGQGSKTPPSTSPSDTRRQKQSQSLLDRQLDRVGRSLSNPVLRAVFQVAKNNPVLFASLVPLLIPGGVSTLVTTGAGAAGIAGGVYAHRRLRASLSTVGDLASQYRATRQQQPARSTGTTLTDVYVRGETTPRLTKAGFEAGRYVYVDPATGRVHRYTHGNEIDRDYGVYEQGEDENDIRLIVPPSLIRTKGLVDPTGKSVGKQVYHTTHSSAQPTDSRSNADSRSGADSRSKAGGQPPKPTRQQTFAYQVRQTLDADFDTPHEPRLNSLAYKEQQAEKKKKNTFYQDIHDIRDSLKSTDKNGKPKKGFLEKLMTGMMGDFGGILFKALDWMLITPTKRMMKIGMFLFERFLGPKSIMIKLLSKGFTLLTQTLLGRRFGRGGDIDIDIPGQGKTTKGRRKGKTKRGRMRGPAGAALKIGAGVAATFGAESVLSSLMDRWGGDNRQGEVEDNDDADSGLMDTIGDGLSTADTVTTAAEAARATGLGTRAAEAAAALGAGSLAVRAGQATEMGTGAIAGAAKASGKGASLAAKVASHVPGTLGLGARVLARANPVLAIGTGIYDGVSGFIDDDSIRNKFHNAPGEDIKTTQRLANAAANVLDLGGIGSWAGAGLANLTGIEALRPDGSIARGIEKGFDIWSKIPGLNTPFIALDFINDKLNERTSDSLLWSCRLAMYGIAKSDTELAKTIASTEAKLAEFVIYNASTGGIKVDPKAPLPALLAPFCQVDTQAGQRWFTSRFLPVWQLWQSALRTAEFKDLATYDKSATVQTLTVAEQVYGALVQLHPYPLDVVVKISNTTGIVPRETAEGIIRDTLKRLADRVSKGKRIEEGAIVTPANHLRTTEELASGETQETNWFGKLRQVVKNQGYAFDEYLSPTPVAVKEIDITDLHKDEKTAIDDLTLTRLGVYGNTQNDSFRVDTVLRLERYCEGLCQMTGGSVTFTEPVEKVYTLFAPAFRQSALTKSTWHTWFNRRFLPVLKAWYEQVYALRHTSPARGWVTLTDTNKFDIAHKLVALKILAEDGKSTETIWNTDASPFPGMKSGTDASTVDPYLSNLNTKVTRAILKSSDAEKRLSQPLNVQNTLENQLTPEARQHNLDIIARAAGGNGSAMLSQPGTASSFATQYAQRTKGDTVPEFTQSSSTYDASYLAADTKEGFTVEKETAIKAIIQAFMKAGLTDPRILAFALANAHAETDFAGRTENLNYTPDALLANFANFRQHPGDAQRYGRTADHPANQQAIGNIAYGGRKDLGNNQPGDGYKYRGRGYTQLTGRYNYTQVAKAVGDPEIVDHPEKVGQDPKYAAESSAGFFKLNPAITNAIMKGNIQAAAEGVGREPKGIAKKMRYFPDYYRRLTEGDLKGLLTEHVDEENKETQEAQTAAAQVAAPGTDSNAAGTDSNTPGTDSNAAGTDSNTPGTETQPGKPTSPVTPESQLAEEALSKTNVAPAVKGEAITPDSLAATAAGKALSAGDSPAPTGQVNLARPVPTTPPHSATPPVSGQVTPHPATHRPGKSQPEPAVQVQFPDQTLNVNDEGVRQAIGQLALAINNLVTKQTGQSGGIDRRVNLGKRQ